MLYEKILTIIQNNKKKIAIRTQNDCYTYDDLNKLIEIVKLAILNQNIDSFIPIGILLPNGINFIAALFAVLSLDFTVVLLGYSFKPSELLYHIKSGGIQIVFSCSDKSECLNTIEGKKLSGVFDADVDLEYWVFDVETSENMYEKKGICQLTSGVGGKSKASLRTQQAILTEINGTIEVLKLNEDIRVLTLTPIHHSYGLVVGTLVPLLLGGEVLFLREFNPILASETIMEHNVNTLVAVPFMYKLLNESKLSDEIDFSQLKYCLSAGAPLHINVYMAFKDRFKKKIIQDYGSTETGLICINFDYEYKYESVGQAITTTEIGIFIDAVRQTETNVVGEVWVRSKGTALRYIYPSKINLESFYNDWYNTYDLGKLDDELYLYITGKKSNIINIDGLKADPVEIENVLLELDQISEAAITFQRTQENRNILKAYIVPSKNAVLTEEEILKHCRIRLSDYKLPRIINFVNELPKTATGKILRGSLQ